MLRENVALCPIYHVILVDVKEIVERISQNGINMFAYRVIDFLKLHELIHKNGVSPIAGKHSREMRLKLYLYGY